MIIMIQMPDGAEELEKYIQNLEKLARVVKAYGFPDGTACGDDIGDLLRTFDWRLDYNG